MLTVLFEHYGEFAFNFDAILSRRIQLPSDDPMPSSGEVLVRHAGRRKVWTLRLNRSLNLSWSAPHVLR